MRYFFQALQPNILSPTSTAASESKKDEHDNWIETRITHLENLISSMKLERDEKLKEKQSEDVNMLHFCA